MVVSSASEGLYSSYTTDDGSFSLYSLDAKEAFHHSMGAHSETKMKFIIPAEFDLYAKEYPHTPLYFLDVCFGLGYGSMLTYAAAQQLGICLHTHALDISRLPLRAALSHQDFRDQCPLFCLELLKSLYRTGAWYHPQLGEGHAYWQDARQSVRSLDCSYDVIYLDAFSAKSCPELWTRDFLAELIRRLKVGGRLITYATSASLRQSLIALGCQVYSTQLPDAETVYGNMKNLRSPWSMGTVAFKPQLPSADSPASQFFWRSPKQGKRPFCSLSIMEREHLETKAAVPYRDPSLAASQEMILARRQTEQNSSKWTHLMTTSRWRRKWQLSQ
ncbi:MAG: MnmC family methyltransferase [Proteobacteria bacterium]|nr:MnmC family methyltransferase [Pseudomonadota bacterium]